MALGTERQRLFFALWPDDALRRTLYKKTRGAGRASGGKPVPAENFHITLAFLGQLDEKGVAAARAAASAVHGEPFDLVLGRLGFWANARVVWLGPAGIPEAGSHFATGLRQALRARGIQVDVRPFLPHLTIARKVTKPGELGGIHPICWRVREFVLIHSVPRRHASEYRPLASWPLHKSAAAAAEL